MDTYCVCRCDYVNTAAGRRLSLRREGVLSSVLFDVTVPDLTRQNNGHLSAFPGRRRPEVSRLLRCSHLKPRAHTPPSASRPGGGGVLQRVARLTPTSSPSVRQKRRSSRQVKRKRYTEELEFRISDDDNNSGDDSPAPKSPSSSQQQVRRGRVLQPPSCRGVGHETDGSKRV